jgi:hypothetical protein
MDYLPSGNFTDRQVTKNPTIFLCHQGIMADLSGE